MELGVFIPIGNNGWLISGTSPQYMPSFELNREIVTRAERGHISAASNSALALANGDFIALLDHDDVLPEHALYRVAAEIERRPDADMLEWSGRLLSWRLPTRRFSCMSHTM